MNAEALVTDWLDMWNGGDTTANDLVTDGFTVHAAMPDGSDGGVFGPVGLAAWVGGIRAMFPDARFVREVGPILQGDHVAVRWTCSGHYAGEGFPGATAPAGTAIAFAGTDLLRLEEGRLAEYWLTNDMHVVIAQLSA